MTGTIVPNRRRERHPDVGKPHDERRRWVVAEVSRCPNPLNHAIPEDGGAVAKSRRCFLFVGDVDDRYRKRCEKFVKFVSESLPDGSIEVRKGFVEQEDIRVGGEHAGQRDALSFATGKRRRRLVEDVRNLESVDQGVDTAGVGGGALNFLSRGRVGKRAPF